MITWSECYEDDDGDDGDGDDDGASDKIDQSAEKRQLPIVQHQSQSRTNHQLSCTNGAQITNNIVKTLQSDIYQVKSYKNQNVPFASGSRPGRGWKCHQHQLLKSQRLQTKDISDTGYFQNNTNINIFKTGYFQNNIISIFSRRDILGTKRIFLNNTGYSQSQKISVKLSNKYSSDTHQEQSQPRGHSWRGRIAGWGRKCLQSDIEWHWVTLLSSASDIDIIIITKWYWVTLLSSPVT